MTATTKIIGLLRSPRAAVPNPTTRRERATITLAIDTELDTTTIIGRRKAVGYAY